MQSSGRPELFHFIFLILMSEYVIFTLSTGEAEIEIAHCVSFSGMTSGKEDWKEGNFPSIFLPLNFIY